MEIALPCYPAAPGGVALPLRRRRRSRRVRNWRRGKTRADDPRKAKRHYNKEIGAQVELITAPTISAPAASRFRAPPRALTTVLLTPTSAYGRMDHPRHVADLYETNRTSSAAFLCFF